MDIPGLSKLIRNSGRFQEVVSILASYGIADWLDQYEIEWIRQLFRGKTDSAVATVSREARVRIAITKLGTTFIKLGQVLSTRPDLVGAKLAEELTQLRANVPSDDPAIVRSIIESELGATVEELFQNFSATSLASASIGQVHEATLHDGTEVVVKVQHPNIEERIQADLDILAMLAEIAEEQSPELRQYQPVATVADFARQLRKEIDFRSELSNLNRFRRNFADHEDVVFPGPYRKLSTRKVLTMDKLSGISLSDKNELRASKMDLENLAMKGATLFVEMIFRDGFYHADPHPGNLMVLEAANASGGQSSKLGVLDCGMVGRINDKLREDLERVLVAIVNRDSEAVVEVIISQGKPPSDLSVEELTSDVEDFIEEYAHQPFDQFDLGGCLTEVIEIIRRHGIVLPSKVAMLLKVLIMLEGTARELNPTFNLIQLIEPHSRRSIIERYSPEKLLENAQVRFRDWDRLMKILPHDAADILHRMKKGSFDVKLSHGRLEATVNRLVIGVLTAAMFMGSASVLSQSVPPLYRGVSVPGAVGCIVAIGLGFHLIQVIRRMSDYNR